jgi:hypothetical protein
MLSLYQLVGLSMLAGVGAMILMVPINALIARLMKTLQKEQMKNKVCPVIVPRWFYFRNKSRKYG